MVKKTLFRSLRFVEITIYIHASCLEDRNTYTEVDYLDILENWRTVIHLGFETNQRRKSKTNMRGPTPAFPAG